jgi:hypothetical protein
MTKKIFRVSTTVYAKIMSDLGHAGGPKKISAIKTLRSAAGAGLKDAKEAIEKIQHEEFGGNYPHASNSACTVVVGPAIKKVVVDFGEGDVEVDLEGMQMKALMEMQAIGLDAARDILDLVEALEAYSSGKKIGVV